MDGFNSFRTVGKYKISNICLETYPLYTLSYI